MTRDFARAIASEVTRCLDTTTTVRRRAGVWVVELTLDGERVTLRDATDWAFLLAEQRNLGAAA